MKSRMIERTPLMTVVSPAPTTANMSEIRSTLKQIIGSPYAAAMLELTMAAIVDAALQESTEPDWIGLVGPPASGKTEAIHACRGSHTRSVDTFASAASLNSGARSITGDQAASFVKEANGHCVLIKDMAALLSEDSRKATAILGALTNAFDGQLNKVVGTSFAFSALQEAESRFALVYASTTTGWLEHSRLVAMLGARSLMYYVPPLAVTSDDFERAKDPRKREYRATLRAQVGARLAQVIEGRAAVSIPEAVDDWLKLGSQFIAVGRTPIRSERIYDDDGKQRYVSSLGDCEGPFRAYQQLRTKLINLCRLNGQTEPTAHELKIIRRVMLSSVTLERAQILAVVFGRETFTAADVVAGTGLADDAVAYRIGTMVSVGLLAQDGSREPYQVAPEFQPVMRLPDGDLTHGVAPERREP